MATEQKAEINRNKKGETIPATAKPKIKKDGVPEKAPIVQSLSPKSHNHEGNGAKSTTSKSPKKEPAEVAGESLLVDDSVQFPPAANGTDVSKMEKTKKKIKEEIEGKDGSLLYQIPMNRVSRIIKSEDPNVRITQEAVYIINKASEKFLQVFTTEAYASAFLDHKKHIDYKHLSSVVSKRRRFDFLTDFVPEKIKAEDALTESQTVES